MRWTRILATLAGDDRDAATLRAARSLAAPFDARLTGVFATAVSAGLFSWTTDEALHSMGMTVGTLQQAESDGEHDAHAELAALDYPRKSFARSTSADWLGLRMSARLSDVVVFDPAAARTPGFFAEAFQQILMDERRPVVIADAPIDLEAPVAVAWDGGPEASRAARRAVPWLQKAKDVVILTAPDATPREFDPDQLTGYLADHQVRARVVQLSGRGDVGPVLLQAAQRIGAKMLVAGAFGHPRLRRFVFGGVTHSLLDNGSGPALFISH